MRALFLLRTLLIAVVVLCALLFAVDAVLFYRLQLPRASLISALYLALFAVPAVQLLRRSGDYARLLAGETVAELNPRAHTLATFTIGPAAIALAAMLLI